MGSCWTGGSQWNELLLGVGGEEEERLRELKEEDVLWDEKETDCNLEENGVSSNNNAGGKLSQYPYQSAAINVPHSTPNNRSETLLQKEENLVPPHEFVAHNHPNLSVVEGKGIGRTLKGRDLTKVRYAVLKWTGFLE
ncbi:hypothetical protein SUGI_0321410 [Cryptomeria japonica]|uniref:protein S40-5-like n=1 Tax=Cryptomeria japonica TaxID=3369 RepID=UPI002408D80C|nr:protein S40-5-like [Cryptomeria japonica]GLJ18183.1 hypothetical protein SUGI_0321410 [Cryptomeria japonica]